MSKMKCATTFTVFCVLLNRPLGSSGFEGCTKQNTFDYTYVKMYPVDILKSQNDLNHQNFRVEFYVKAASNAHILLSEDEDPNYGTAWEIVIGAGQNLFSQIRIYGRGNKASQSTIGIMSPIEFNGFWIELHSGRLIRVGKIGQAEPFLFWVGPNKSFIVRYFGFATWKNVKGEWYFNCVDKSSRDPGIFAFGDEQEIPILIAENVEGDTNMTDIQRLKNDLLTFINPTVAPQREGYPNEIINAHLEATYFLMDEKRGELTLSGTAFLKWMDSRLTWEPASYGGLNYMYVMPFHIWTPDIQVLNSLSLGKNFLLVFGGNVLVKNNGEIFWRVPFNSVTLCQLGYANWPFDTHNCTLVFGFWTDHLKINVKHMSVLKISKSEWEIQKIHGEEISISQDDDLGGIIDISFRRREPSYEFLLLPPFLGAAILTLASFWCRPNSPAKLFLNCGSILILILVLMSICGRIANTVTATPKIVFLYSWSVFIICIPIILYITLKYVPPYVHLPRWLSSALNSELLKILFLLPENAQSELNSYNLREEEERSISGMRLVTLIERFLFLIFFGVLTVPFIAFLTKFEVFNI